MPKSSSFEVISLGKLFVVDTGEGNNLISRSNGEELLGSYGTAESPLSNNIHMFDPGLTGYVKGSSAGYDGNNNTSNDKFTIDGGPGQTHDATMLYSGTVTYTDGETVEVDQLWVAQDNDGNSYLIPPSDDPDSPLSAKPIQSITLDALTDTTAYSLPGQQEADGFVGDPQDPEVTGNSTVFDVISLGVIPQMDDGNENDGGVNTANVEMIANKTYGSETDPLAAQIQRWAPGSAGTEAAGTSGNTSYDVNNDDGNDTFTIDGGPDKIHDVAMEFSGSVITYFDGTTSGEIAVVISQAKDGSAYLVPSFSSDTAAIMRDKPIQSITLGDPVYEGEANNGGSATAGSRPTEAFRVPCFTTDVPIQTPFGYIIADKLKAGDFVTTADHEEQQIRWVGKRHIDSIDLATNPKLRPIRIRKDALGAGLPTEDILVSRQHRMLVRSQIARDMFGVDEVLVPAIKLTEWPGIEIADDVSEVTYIHFLFDRHEIVFAAGAPSESLFTGSEALKALSDETRQEIFTLFPELESTGHAFAPARELLSNKMSKNLIAQHTKKIRPLIKESTVRR